MRTQGDYGCWREVILRLVRANQPCRLHTAHNRHRTIHNLNKHGLTPSHLASQVEFSSSGAQVYWPRMTLGGRRCRISRVAKGTSYGSRSLVCFLSTAPMGKPGKKSDRPSVSYGTFGIAERTCKTRRHVSPARRGCTGTVTVQEKDAANSVTVHLAPRWGRVEVTQHAFPSAAPT